MKTLTKHLFFKNKPAYDKYDGQAANPSNIYVIDLENAGFEVDKIIPIYTRTRNYHTIPQGFEDMRSGYLHDYCFLVSEEHARSVDPELIAALEKHLGVING